MSTYAIGDLHGRYDLLERVIDTIEAHAGAAGGTFVVLGDFVDRGPQSREIIERLMAGPTHPNWRWVVLQGNHEAMMLLAHEHPGTLKWWCRNGGDSTLESYGYWEGDPFHPHKVPMHHLEWLEGLPVVHEDEHRIYVHAGVRFDEPVVQTPQETLQWMLYPSDRHYEGAEIHPDLPHCSGKHTVHGHHQSPKHPLLKPHRTNLDTCAFASGRITIGVFDGPGGPVELIDVLARPTL